MSITTTDSGVDLVERGRTGEPVVTGLSDRLAERQRARRRLRIRAIVAAVIAALLLVGAGYVLLASPLVALKVDEVQVSGANEIASAEEVLAVAQRYDGQPLLRLDTGGLREELLTIVGVREATVQREFPHGLAITIEPRVPVATVEHEGGYVLLDADGVELAATEEPHDGVPVVQVPVGTEATADALDAVLTVMAALPQGILERVATASATSAHEVEFELSDGARVVWGSADDNDLKAAVLESLLPVEAELYDVSAPLSPITR
ncbi:cell division protein FtsQ/DivIB [Pseudactinotalea sp.]|uniref:cell division protein FtsQ/DivIB n=1 Tax=Pseudactinotalea sp. TaxID=1926260 RepID=UPI003B3AE993